MNEILIHIFGISVTGWKLVGYTGALLFTGRWFIQLYASTKAGKPVMTQWFWILSFVGSLTLLSYFIFGKNDSVGILSNLFPTGIALYNLFLDAKHRKSESAAAKK